MRSDAHGAEGARGIEDRFGEEGGRGTSPPIGGRAGIDSVRLDRDNGAVGQNGDVSEADPAAGEPAWLLGDEAGRRGRRAERLHGELEEGGFPGDGNSTLEDLEAAEGAEADELREQARGRGGGCEARGVRCQYQQLGGHPVPVGDEKVSGGCAGVDGCLERGPELDQEDLAVLLAVPAVIGGGNHSPGALCEDGPPALRCGDAETDDPVEGTQGGHPRRPSCVGAGGPHLAP